MQNSAESQDASASRADLGQRNSTAAGPNSVSTFVNVILAATLFSYLAQISIGIAILVVSTERGEYCSADEDGHLLIVYLVGQVLRLAAAFSVVLLLRLFPPPTQAFPMQASLAGIERQPTILQRFKNSLDAVSVIWFIFGNYALFSSSGCAATAPMQYNLTIAFVTIGYMILLFPVLAVLMLVFCLPFVVLTMRLTGMAMPTMPHHPMAMGLAGALARQQQPCPESVIGSIPSQVYASDADIKKEDAHCVICLSEYVASVDTIKKLSVCGHHFHGTCLDNWLRVRGSCPTCRSEVRAGSDLEAALDG